MKTKCYLVELHGVKDHEYALADKMTFDWIIKGGKMPEEIKKRYTKEHKQYSSDVAHDIEVLEKLSQYQDNDRAMAMTCCWVKSFWSSLELQKWLAKNKHKVSVSMKEGYEGYLY